MINLDKLKETKEILDKRYLECNSKGHIQPDNKENTCNYCYRTLIYKTPATDAILKDREKLPIQHQPMDAPIIMEKGKREIESQKFMDRMQGLTKLEEELSFA
ncbi:hypothetical protein CMI40_00285 [Candidatus Pacearchaeota archaeon]|jgi:hypothetical protein|nr:hypothetical protein [Candidatus Pacearchaeota archaeon]|tara:strand:- start:1905 stop:2213 length:309 start_codon:yes stop_codon:yes gene_type:complete